MDSVYLCLLSKKRKPMGLVKQQTTRSMTKAIQFCIYMYYWPRERECASESSKKLYYSLHLGHFYSDPLLRRNNLPGITQNLTWLGSFFFSSTCISYFSQILGLGTGTFFFKEASGFINGFHTHIFPLMQIKHCSKILWKIFPHFLSTMLQHHYWNYRMKQTSATSEVRIPSKLFLWTGSFNLSKGYSARLIL